MYFKTIKTGNTGLKFKSVLKEMKMVWQSQREIAEEIGFHEWRSAYMVVDGGISSVIFKEKPDTKTWKEVYPDEWMPRLSTKAGKEIQAKFDKLPVVTFEALNSCVGFKATFKHIGFYHHNEKYFGIKIKDEWHFNPPYDCEEITYSEFKKLFEKGI